MKKVIFILFLLCSCLAQAQLDTEHWFAPMVQNANNGNNFMNLYLSTNDTTPFEVNVENNNIIIAIVTLSKGNPQKVEIDNSLMKTFTQDSIRVVTTKGLHVYADKKFFANLRFSNANHAEIITSKGRAGLGTNFLAVYAPFAQTNGVMNFSLGFIATENNTEVSFKSTYVTTTFNLNKGESYIYEGFPEDNSVIGAEITSNKPISITNGNFNGQYASQNNQSGTDILMDQAVPIERLGQEFILMKGNGNLVDGMESAIIVATEDNTEIYFNDETTPYTQPLNKGDYILMPSSKYQLKNSGNDVYSAYVKSTKKVYVYQLLSGSGSLASGGFNYIPPLNCYLPKKIDELGFIDENEGYLYQGNVISYFETHPTKLNIITQVDATVQINGSTLGSNYGPYVTAGTTEWVTYSVPSVSGTVVIESTKAVTAGIAAGNQAIGYGGYFAGASSLPIITKKGECLPGITLEVDDTFDTYQWQKFNVTTGLFDDIVGANTYTYVPTEEGEYRCVLGSDICGTIETPSYTALKCTVESQIDVITCDSYVITPKFTVSKQTINPEETRITSQPKYGTVSITNGKITYTANAGFTDGTVDSFIFYIEGDATYPESELVTVNITLRSFEVKDAELTSCLINGYATYNLSEADITDGTGFTVSYFETLTDAESNVTANAIADYENFETDLPEVYARVESSLGCSLIATITLSHFPVPDLDTSLFNSVICDDNLDGVIPINFSEVIPVILSNYQNFTTSFYLDAAHTQVLPTQWSYANSTTVYVEVVNNNGCPSVSGEIYFSIGVKIPLNKASSQTICDNELLGSIDVDLSDYVSLFTNDSSVSVTYYATESNARSETGSISSAINLSDSKIYYLRFENATNCPEVNSLELVFSQPQTSAILEDAIICADATTGLSVEENTYDGILWSTGSTDTNITVGVGDYYVDLTTGLCTYRQLVSVTGAEDPSIYSIEINGSTAIIYGSGGTPSYQYAVDNQNFGSTNTFANLSRGLHTAYLKDSFGCIVISQEFYVINIGNAITPNGDGLNDIFDYSDLQYKDDVLMEIYDRYGKLVFKGTPNNQYTWNGTDNGRVLPTAAYWIIIQWKEPMSGSYIKHADWVLLKNRN